MKEGKEGMIESEWVCVKDSMVEFIETLLLRVEIVLYVPGQLLWMMGVGLGT